MLSHSPVLAALVEHFDLRVVELDLAVLANTCFLHVFHQGVGRRSQVLFLADLVNRQETLDRAVFAAGPSALATVVRSQSHSVEGVVAYLTVVLVLPLCVLLGCR